MKKQVFYQKAGLLTAMAAIFFSAQNVSAQFSSTSPGGAVTQYNNAPVGVQVSSITSGMSLDLGNDLSIRGGHLVYNSSNGVMDWGSGGSGNLYFRVLNTQGVFGSGYNNLMTILGNGNVGIGTATPASTSKLEVHGSLSVYTSNSNYSLFFGQDQIPANQYGEWGIQYLPSTTGGNGGLNFWKPFVTDASGYMNAGNNFFFLRDNGNIGIGTGTPTTRLNVSGADATGRVATFQNGNPNVVLSVNMASAGYYSLLTQANDNGIIWSDAAAGGGQNSTSGLVIAPWSGSANGIRIDGVTGNVRMGQWVYTGNAGNAGSAMNWPNAFYGMNMYRNSTGNWVGTTDGAHNGGGLMFADMGGNVRFESVPSSSAGNSNQSITDAQMYTNVALTITPSEQVVIGSPNLTIATPGAYKLYVAGGILTEKLRVALVNSSSWADYVFDESYKLKPLNEVESFIKVNNHLPEVPSAQEVAKDGVDVVAMDATLLKKVEELTLYVIEQNKRIEAQDKKIQELESTAVKTK